LSSLDDLSVAEISTDTIIRLCDSTGVSSCSNISSFLPEILVGRKNKDSTKAVCQRIHFCEPGKGTQMAVKKQGEPTDLTCEICQFSMGFLQLLNSSGKLSLTDVPTKICQQLPNPANGICLLFWQNYGLMFQKTLETGEQLSDTCKNMNMCSQKMGSNFTTLLSGLNVLSSLKGNPIDTEFLKTQLSQLNANQNPNQVSNAQCQLCQWGVSAVEAYLAQDTTEDELSRVFQELCTVLPGTYAGVCENFVLVYMSEAVGFIIDTFTPPFVCSKVGFC